MPLQSHSSDAPLQFERGRERYIDLHINNLASNMGINRSRITFESARRGSVIFVTAIADVAPASRQPNEASAADAVAVLDSKIRTGSFEEVGDREQMGQKLIDIFSDLSVLLCSCTAMLPN